MLFPSSHHDIDKRLSTLVDSVTDLTVTVKTMATKHEALSQDQDILFKKVDKNEHEIRNMQQHTVKIESVISTLDKQSITLENLKTASNNIAGVTKVVQWGGTGLIAIIIASWSNLSSKVDVVAAKTENNTQNITYLQKDNLDDQKQIDAMAAKIADNRETILTRLKAKKDKDE